MDPTESLVRSATGNLAGPVSATSTATRTHNHTPSDPQVTEALSTFTKFLRAEIQNFAKNRDDGQTLFADWFPGVTTSDDSNVLFDKIADVGRDAVSSLNGSSPSTLRLDTIYNELTRIEMVSRAPEHREDILQLLFFLFGRLTMLYCPAILPRKPTCLGITMEGRDCYQKDSLPISTTKRPIVENIHGFGLALPKPPDFEDIAGSVHDCNEVLDSRLLNADAICKFAVVTIRWSTCIFSHLSFCDSARCLTLFALPSFCLLHSGNEPSLLAGLYSSLAGDEDAEDRESSNEALHYLLEEVLLSYHLLFGMDSRSRKVFKREALRCEASVGMLDPLLLSLCSRRPSPALDPDKIGKPSYSATGDFRMLYDRMMTIQEFVGRQGPKNPAHIWRDRRDLNMSYTFRAVIVFGTIGVVLSTIQTFLTGFSYKVAKQQLDLSCPCEVAAAKTS